MRNKRFFRIMSLFLALSVLLSACGGGGGDSARATTMHLRKTEGTVRVSDDKGGDLEVRDDLSLYSGYDLRTRDESYAWVDLDAVKLTKMDQNTRAEIEKDGKDLEIVIKEGSLFFHVTEPLADDETMTIRTSTMAVGIRGTCGWVEVPEDEGIMRLYLLEGKVECEADGETELVLAGEMATMTEDGDIDIEDFPAESIPVFVLEEIREDEDLAEAIFDDAGLDLEELLEEPGESEDAPEAPSPVSMALEAYRAIVPQAASYEYNGAMDPTGDYRYALVKMQAEYDLPALLLEQDTTFGVSSIIVFQYDPATGTASQASGNMSEGVGSAGGYRGGLTAAGDGLGAMETSWSSGTGEGGTDRYTLSGGALVRENVWSGNVVMDTDPTSTVDIVWHEISDLSGLDSWTPSGAPQAPEDTQPPDAVPADETLYALPAEFVGEYTAVDSGSYFPVTFSSDGKCTGNGDRGGSGPYNHYYAAPQSIVQSADGAVTVTFSYCTYTFYPAGLSPAGENLRANAVNLCYVTTTGSGSKTVWYYRET